MLSHLDLAEEVDAAGTVAVVALVAVANGRPVRDENVRAGRNPLPILRNVVATVQVEGPVIKGRLPRAAPDPHALNLAPLVLQIPLAKGGRTKKKKKKKRNPKKKQATNRKRL